MDVSKLDFSDLAGGGRVTADHFRVKRGWGRQYVMPPPDGPPLVSVTSLLGRVYPLGGLMRWSKRNLLDHIRRGNGLGHVFGIEDQREWQKARDRLIEEGEDRSAAQFGTLVHELVAARLASTSHAPVGASGGEFDWATPVGDRLEEAQALANLCFDTLEAAGLMAYQCEVPVFKVPEGRTQGYAGTLDIVAAVSGNNLPDQKPGDLVMLDLKTGRSMRPSFPAQIAAYAHADFFVESTGKAVAMPRLSGGYVLHARAGRCDLYPVDMERGKRLWDAALTWDTERIRSEKALAFGQRIDLDTSPDAPITLDTPSGGTSTAPASTPVSPPGPGGGGLPPLQL